MKATTFDMMRVWASLTGLMLVLWYFAAVYFAMGPSKLVPMLVAAIGGFELFLFAQDVWLARRGRHG